MDFGFLDELSLKIPFRITLSPALTLNPSPLKARVCSLTSGTSLPPDSLETAYQVPCSFSLSFLSASVSAREFSFRLAAVGRVEPRIDELKPSLDDAVTRRRAVLEERPLAMIRADAGSRRIPAKVLPARRQDDKHAILPGFELLVTAHAEGSDHETHYGFHDVLGCQAGLSGKTCGSGHPPAKVVKV